VTTRARRLLACVLLFAAVVLAYLPSLGNGFVDWDDQEYVVRNPHVDGLTAANVAWAFATFHGGNWHPLTWLSHAADRQLFELDPRGHHATSILLHAANAVLVFLALFALTAREGPSLAVAALFALHPLRVESVAWVAERKDLLCAFFVLGTLLAYVRYVRRPGVSAYAAVAAGCALALLSKPMAVTTPLLLLLCDAWPLARVRDGKTAARAIREKLPLMALAAACALLTLRAQERAGAIRAWDAIGLAERLANAPVAAVAYLGKLVWPAPGTLSPLYTHPHDLGSPLRPLAVAGAAVLLLAITVAAAAAWRRRPYQLFGWVWFAVTVAPVIGRVPVGAQRMADRYTYLPLLGPSLAVVWLAAEWAANRQRRRLLAGLGVLVAVGLLALSWRQQRVWKDATTLWQYAVASEPQSPVARLNLANVYRESGRAAEALQLTREAVALNPRYAPAQTALGVRLGDAGDLEEAIARFQEALALRPQDAGTRASLGNALLARGRADEALRELRGAAEAAPNQVAVRASLARALVAVGRADEAIPHFEAVVALDPLTPARHNDLAVAYLRAGRPADGIAQLREAVRLDPRYRSGHLNLSLALEQAGDLEGARRHRQTADELGRGRSTGVQ
jgi:tetratricopeptide (TPR) repeat protein